MQFGADPRLSSRFHEGEGRVFKKRVIGIVAVGLAGAIWAGGMASGAPAAAPTPPGQPKTGPGGSDYRHAKVLAQKYGKGATEYWLYEPSEPAPKSAPLVIFMHGWLAYVPGGYIAWTDHLVRRGNIVVYPVYQDSLFTAADKFTPNTVRAVQDAIQELQTGPHVRPELDKFALVGHSAGGVITADLAVRAKGEGLPMPKAIMIVEPGRGNLGGKPNLPVDDYTQMPAEALLLVVIGETYSASEDVWPARRIFRDAPMPAANKNFVKILSDSHGKPPLISDHFTACGKWGGWRRMEVDALDYYAHWKPFDALCDAAFHGRNRNVALGNTTRQRFLGRWSDGTAVRELEVQDKL
jgi:acetyl esterase/lipase